MGDFDYTHIFSAGKSPGDFSAGKSPSSFYMPYTLRIGQQE
jgi:hypothetical protein